MMMRNLPNNYTRPVSACAALQQAARTKWLCRSMLLQLLDSRDFAGQYDFLYLPIDFTRRANLGYAFVNLVSEDRQLSRVLWCFVES